MAASSRSDVRITVIDVGGQLEEAHAAVRGRMAASDPAGWSPDERLTIGRLPVDSGVKGLPEKRAYGSDFPFRDFGQRAGLTAAAGLNERVVSGAYGGFSNVWGAQIMPFTRETFRAWPVEADEMYRHYAAVLREVPHAAEADDLESLFPILGDSQPLPRVSARTEGVLSRYDRSRGRLRRRGVALGRARLALNARACVHAGLCMTGCPYSLIYSAAHTMDDLRRRGAVEYHGGLLALRVEEGGDGATVTAKELATGRLQQFSADRVVLACGALGTSRLVMGSLGLYDTPVRVSESVQFMLPFFSRRPVPDPRSAADFTLNQFNMIVDLDGNGYDVSQLHFYTYDPSFQEALPGPLRAPWADAPRGQLLRRLSVALGYLPSWGSPTFQIRARRGRSSELAPLEIGGDGNPGFGRNTMLRETLRRVVAAAPSLDLWPVLPMLRMSAGAKSYHWGATFPHAAQRAGRFSSDVLGRVGPWQRIHLADASVFPTVPATTFTLTIMANAHRIVTRALAPDAA
jgi:ferredoxin